MVECRARLEEVVPLVALHRKYEYFDFTPMETKDGCCATLDDYARVSTMFCAVGDKVRIKEVEFIGEGPETIWENGEPTYEVTPHHNEVMDKVYEILPDADCEIEDVHDHELLYGSFDPSHHIHMICRKEISIPEFRRFAMELLQFGQEEQFYMKTGEYP